jgi:hypothetical protein
MRSHYCPVRFSGSRPNSLKISPIIASASLERDTLPRNPMCYSLLCRARASKTLYRAGSRESVSCAKAIIIMWAARAGSDRLPQRPYSYKTRDLVDTNFLA